VSLFHVACEMDLEGIVAKWKSAPYRMDSYRTSWVKIKNPNYSQAEGRRELFEKFRSPQGEGGSRSRPYSGERINS